MSESERPPVDPLREALDTAMDVGIYPVNGGPDMSPRTPWQDGWNAACIEIAERVEAFWDARIASPAAQACICGKPAPMAGTCFDIDGDFWPGHGSDSPAAPRPEGLARFLHARICDPKAYHDDTLGRCSALAAEYQRLSDTGDTQ